MAEQSLADLQARLERVRAAIQTWEENGGVASAGVDDRNWTVDIKALHEQERALMHRIRIHPDNANRRPIIRRVVPMDRR